MEDDKPLGDSTENRPPLKDSDDDVLFSEYSDDGTPSKHSDDTGPTPTDTDGETETVKNSDDAGCTLRHHKSHLAKESNTSLPGTPTHITSHPARDGASEQHKATAIHDIVAGTEEDGVERLRQLSISRGGLVNDELRRIAWPKLLKVDVHKIPLAPDVSVLHAHRDYNQVVLDVNRSQKRFPPGMEEVERLEYQDQLIDTILRVLVHQPDLHYYQGYHDIVVTFLLVVGEDLTFALMNELSTKHLREFMHPTMDQTNYMLNFLYPLISLANAKLGDFMLEAETGTIFCLPWLITWYGHVLNDFRYIVRLYDFFIACHPLMPIYLAATIVLYRSEEILALPPEMPLIHSLLSHIPGDLPMERLIAQAGDLYVQYPPDTLKEEADRLHRKEQERIEQTRLATEHARKARQQRLRQQQGARFRKRVSVWTLAAVVVAGLSWSIMYWRQLVLW